MYLQDEGGLTPGRGPIAGTDDTGDRDNFA